MNNRPSTDFVSETYSLVNKTDQNYKTLMEYIRGDMDRYRLGSMNTVLDSPSAASNKIVAKTHDYNSANFKDSTILNK
jgi:hypothetical protein